MTKYSLKEVFYKNSFLLNEMAIITPKNFLEKIIKLCNEKPQLIGDPSITSVEKAFDKIDDNLFNKKKYLTQMQTNEFLYKLQDEYKEKEASRLKSIEIRKSKGIKVNEKDLKPITLSEEEKEYRLKLFEATAVKEKSIALEVIKIVHVTNLLKLKGKENKKKLKEAEEILIQQLRKHKNADGEFIEFKKVLPMFDSIIQYIEKSADVDIDSCIKAADLYMRVYYEIARKEEKDEIDKGNFDFNIIMKRMSFASRYKQKSSSNAVQMSNESLLKVYEDDDMLIVYPTSYQSFCYMIEDVLDIKDLTWCTYRSESTWSSYNSSQYVAIAHSKKVENDEEAYIISLKVEKNGTIDVQGTCDSNNDHVDSDFLFKYITSEMEEEIAKLPNQVDLGADITELEDDVIGLSKLNDVNELKNCFAQSFAFAGAENSMDLYELMCTETSLAKEDAAEVIVDSVSYYIFDNLGAETLYFTDFFNVKNIYPKEEIYNNLKNKILNQRSHPRYFNAFLEIQKKMSSSYSFKQLDFNEFKKALEVACNTNNINNLKRIIKLVLESDEFTAYLNPYKISNKSEGLTKNNIEIYDMLINSQGIKTYISEFGINAISKISNGLSSTGSFRPDVFISHLIIRYPELFVNKLQEKIDEPSENLVNRIDFNLVTRYIIEDARSKLRKFLAKEGESERRFISLSQDSYQKIKENILTEYKTFSLIKDYLKNKDAYVLYRLIAHNMEKSNSLDMSFSQDEFNIFNDLTSFKAGFKGADYFANFMTFLNLYKKNVTDLSSKTLENIVEFVENTFDNDNDMVEQEACRNFFNKAILNSTERDFDFKYTYEIFKLLDDELKIKIISGAFYEISMSVVRDEQINNKIKNIQNKSKIFIESSMFINMLNNNGIRFDHQGHAKVIYLILTFLDFMPIEKRKNYFSQFINNVFMTDKSNLSYHSAAADQSLTTSGIENIDQQIICSEETISAIRNHLMNVIRHYGKTELHTRFINIIIGIFTQNNKAFPKDIMQAIATKSSGQNYNSANGTKNFFKNFIGISEDGGNHLYGKELSIVRETLKELFRNKNFKTNKSMFGTRYSKEIAFEIVQKMGKHARMHMGMAFPDEAQNLRANTPEEEAELQADSLIRQYIKMLLS